jgi:hypothetical protein
MQLMAGGPAARLRSPKSAGSSINGSLNRSTDNVSTALAKRRTTDKSANTSPALAKRRATDKSANRQRGSG